MKILNSVRDSEDRDQNNFFHYIYSKLEKSVMVKEMIRGLDFWFYTGEGWPLRTGEFWRQGDPLSGDPPHE